jgi:hypothetical protein
MRGYGAVIDDQSDPGFWADMIAHSPCLRVEWFGEAGDD